MVILMGYPFKKIVHEVLGFYVMSYFHDRRMGSEEPVDPSVFS